MMMMMREKKKLKKVELKVKKMKLDGGNSGERIEKEKGRIGSGWIVYWV